MAPDRYDYPQGRTAEAFQKAGQNTGSTPDQQFTSALSQARSALTQYQQDLRAALPGQTKELDGILDKYYASTRGNIQDPGYAKNNVVPAMTQALDDLNDIASKNSLQASPDNIDRLKTKAGNDVATKIEAFANAANALSASREPPASPDAAPVRPAPAFGARNI